MILFSVEQIYEYLYNTTHPGIYIVYFQKQADVHIIRSIWGI